MSNYVLSCCSTADLTKEHFEKRDIHYICFHYELDGKSYPDDLGQTMPFEEFYQAIDDVMSGRIYLNQTGLLMLEETCSHLSSLRDTVVHREVLPEGSQPCPLTSCHLSEREKQVLHLYVNGYKSSEIGGILYMSVNTVETHKKRIKEKLNLTRKADLLTYAMEHGLFEDWD